MPATATTPTTGIKGLEHFDAAVVKAYARPGSVAKVQPGWYLAVVNGELIEIERREYADEYNGWWDSAPASDKRQANDPQPTLAAVKTMLGI